MFDSLQEKISRTIKNLRGHGKITEENGLDDGVTALQQLGLIKLAA